MTKYGVTMIITAENNNAGAEDIAVECNKNGLKHHHLWLDGYSNQFFYRYDAA